MSVQKLTSADKGVKPIFDGKLDLKLFAGATTEKPLTSVDQKESTLPTPSVVPPPPQAMAPVKPTPPVATESPVVRIIKKFYAAGFGDSHVNGLLATLGMKDISELSSRPDLRAQFEKLVDDVVGSKPGAITQPAPDEWPEPENIFKDLAAPAFDGSEFPPELAQFALLDAKQTGFDAGIGLNAALAVASMAINDQIKVCANSATRWFEEARLWILIIAPPGIGKTPGQKPMIAPLWTIHGQLYAAWEKLDADWNALPKKNRPPRPPAPRVLLTDVTMARLSDVLKDNPRGIGLVVDEFSSWFGALDMQSNAGAGGHDRGEALMLFQGGPHQIERVTRGSIFVPNWSVGILTGSTPDQMRIYAKHLPEDGLIQRILAYLAHDKVTPEPASVAHEQQLDAARQRYTQIIERLWGLIPMSHGGVVQMSQEAREYFAKWCASVDEHVKAYRELVPPLAGHVAKFPTMALRIALTFHCVQVVSVPPPTHGMHDAAATPLSLATITRATDYLARSVVHARAMYMGLSGSTGPIGVAREVANYILVHKAPDNVLARRDLLRQVHGYTKADEGTQGDAMRFLEEMGWVRVTEGGQRRSTGPTRYAVNPKIAERFATETVREKERRQVARELIGVAAAARREKP